MFHFDYKLLSLVQEFFGFILWFFSVLDLGSVFIHVS